MARKIRMARTLRRFGVSLSVYTPSILGSHLVAGEERQTKLKDVDPDRVLTVSEPLVPVKYGVNSFLADGGEMEEYTATWYSMGDYPVKTVIINQRSGLAYRVIKKQDYQDYADTNIYLVKEVSVDDL
ncbi:hypothetical protein [Lactiplantibacillus mudanjiangensis]|uniref:Uncharacterized protein n=1 Tax=Lactiplantibacillus mudanjiangensis TaxID=1296538 RepID=A0A660E4E5_9LACO|nr:hypothetical protein [Lactiplantibacillus mudanjiangensis]VDG23669.1 hypothetical protein [Lactobacillus brevis KB290] [Lactiplantibacillus mudanjiangensis]VDG27812.1 hypothetical protein [Lactobacillus brevis KB290] [Lactiplantibacillus mudanjiangensis]